jgi:hypothetical protein
MYKMLYATIHVFLLFSSLSAAVDGSISSPEPLLQRTSPAHHRMKSSHAAGFQYPHTLQTRGKKKAAFQCNVAGNEGMPGGTRTREYSFLDCGNGKRLELFDGVRAPPDAHGLHECKDIF